MTDLTDFLLARIAEDEAAARAAVRWSEGASQWADAGEPDWEHITRWDPARVLAECEAKRRIVEMIWASPLDITTPYGRERVYTLFHLALPYADHPDYDPAWRP